MANDYDGFLKRHESEKRFADEYKAEHGHPPRFGRLQDLGVFLDPNDKTPHPPVLLPSLKQWEQDAEEHHRTYSGDVRDLEFSEWRALWGDQYAAHVLSKQRHSPKGPFADYRYWLTAPVTCTHADPHAKLIPEHARRPGFPSPPSPSDEVEKARRDAWVKSRLTVSLSR